VKWDVGRRYNHFSPGKKEGNGRKTYIKDGLLLIVGGGGGGARRRDVTPGDPKEFLERSSRRPCYEEVEVVKNGNMSKVATGRGEIRPGEIRPFGKERKGEEVAVLLSSAREPE